MGGVTSASCSAPTGGTDPFGAAPSACTRRVCHIFFAATTAAAATTQAKIAPTDEPAATALRTPADPREGVDCGVDEGGCGATLRPGDAGARAKRVAERPPELSSASRAPPGPATTAGVEVPTTPGMDADATADARRVELPSAASAAGASEAAHATTRSTVDDTAGGGDEATETSDPPEAAEMADKVSSEKHAAFAASACTAVAPASETLTFAAYEETAGCRSRRERRRPPGKNGGETATEIDSGDTPAAADDADDNKLIASVTLRSAEPLVGVRRSVNCTIDDAATDDAPAAAAWADSVSTPGAADDTAAATAAGDAVASVDETLMETKMSTAGSQAPLVEGGSVPAPQPGGYGGTGSVGGVAGREGGGVGRSASGGGGYGGGGGLAAGTSARSMASHWAALRARTSTCDGCAEGSTRSGATVVDPPAQEGSPRSAAVGPGGWDARRDDADEMRYATLQTDTVPYFSVSIHSQPGASHCPNGCTSALGGGGIYIYQLGRSNIEF